MSKKQPIKEAVCVVIRNNGRYLATTRRHNTTLWGLPGGKVDPGETPEQAVVREVFEETGLVLEITHLKKVFQQVCHGDVPYNTTTFEYDAPLDFSTIKAEEGLIVDFIAVEILLNPRTSPFSTYNLELLGGV